METDEKTTRDLKVLIAWRFEQLVAAGSDNHSAQLISERTDIPVNEAVNMLEHKCSPSLMVAILL